MSLGPAEIILILVVALIAFGPQRLPEIARQVGTAVRELRRMQDQVRGELEQVLRPDFVAPNPDGSTPALEDTDHTTGPGSGQAASDMTPPDATPPADPPPSETTPANVTDDGFAGPRSFS